MTAIRVKPARSKTADPVLAEATQLALDAAVEEAGSAAFVGEPLGIAAEDDRVVVHSFACRLPAYRGWHWAVVLTRAPRTAICLVSPACPEGTTTFRYMWTAPSGTMVSVKLSVPSCPRPARCILPPTMRKSRGLAANRQRIHGIRSDESGLT